MTTDFPVVGYWIKQNPTQPKGYKFICSCCGGFVNSTAMDKTKKVSICTYRYCPHCGRPMEVFR